MDIVMIVKPIFDTSVLLPSHASSLNFFYCCYNRATYNLPMIFEYLGSQVVRAHVF